MKYIQILRYLNLSSPYAFPDCNDLAALQVKMTERRTAAESINITNGPLSMKIVKELGDDQIEVLLDRCTKLLDIPAANRQDLFSPERISAESIKNMLELIKITIRNG